MLCCFRIPAPITPLRLLDIIFSSIKKIIQALLLVAVGGVDLLASGGGATRVTTLLLLVGLASLPIVLSILEW